MNGMNESGSDDDMTSRSSFVVCIRNSWAFFLSMICIGLDLFTESVHAEEVIIVLIRDLLLIYTPQIHSNDFSCHSTGSFWFFFQFSVVLCFKWIFEMTAVRVYRRSQTLDIENLLLVVYLWADASDCIVRVNEINKDEEIESLRVSGPLETQIRETHVWNYVQYNWLV